MPEAPELRALRAHWPTARRRLRASVALTTLGAALALRLAMRRAGMLGEGHAPPWSPLALGVLVALALWPALARRERLLGAAPVAEDPEALRWIVWRLLERARDEDRRGYTSWPTVSSLLGGARTLPRLALPSEALAPAVHLVARTLSSVTPGAEPLEERVRDAVRRSVQRQRVLALTALGLLLALAAAVLLGACNDSSAAPHRVTRTTRTVVTRAPSPSPSRAAQTPPAAADPRSNAGATLSRSDWVSALFPDGVPADLAARCPAGAPDEGACLRAQGWARWPAMLPEAERAWTQHGLALGLGERFTMDGGYRGMVPFAPEAPVGAYARHLAWVNASWEAFERFFAEVERAHGGPVPYRWRGVRVRFSRSLRGHSPAAYALHWTLTYNLVGGINTDPERVRSTLFHELFHLNDEAHGWWSPAHLEALYQSIVARCGARTACLEPFAPNTLRVRNGTYYSFQPGNDVREYAAELAVRYFNEQTGRWPGAPFRCGPPENARAWRLFVDEFFGGVDRGPPCPARTP